MTVWQNQARALCVLGVVATGLYVNTIGFDYAFDDNIVITGNRYTQQGLQGIGKLLREDTFSGFLGEEFEGTVVGGRYRPLSLVTFAVEWELFAGNPHVSHGGNLVLYVVSCCLLYLVLLELAGQAGLQHAKLGAFWGALLFAVHPVHTEAVANIKGRDEVLAVALVLALWLLALRKREPWNGLWMALGGVLLFLACLSKESAIVWCVLVPASLWCCRASRCRLLHVAAPLVGAAVLFVILRAAVIGAGGAGEVATILNDPFMEAGEGERVASALAGMVDYVRLALWPHPLTIDYYPFVREVLGWGAPKVWAGALLTLAGGLFAVWGVWRQRLWGLVSAIFLLCLLPVGNFFFTVGVFVAERFVYAPSVAVAVAILLVMARAQPLVEGKRSVLFGLLAVVLVGCGLTVSRNRAWRDSLTLYLADAERHPRGIKARSAAGGALYLRAMELPEGPERTEMLQQSVAYLEGSVALLPDFVQARESLGYAWMELDIAQAVPVFLAVERDFGIRYNTAFQLARCYDQLRQPEKALVYYRKAAIKRPSSFSAHYNTGLRMLTERPEDADGAIRYLSMASQLNPQHPDSWKNLGVALRRAKRWQEALTVLRRAAELDPGDPRLRAMIQQLEKRGSGSSASRAGPGEK